MAGILDVMNNQTAGPDDPQVAPSFFCGLFLMKIAGIRTNAQLKSILEGEIGRSTTVDETQDLLDIVGYIDAGSGEAEAGP